MAIEAGRGGQARTRARPGPGQAGRAAVEVNERRGCPSPRTLRAFTSAGVRLVAASGSQDADGVGRYDSVAETFRELGQLPS